MDPHSKQALLAAANYLVTGTDAHTQFRRLTKAINFAATNGISVRLSGELEHLDVLLQKAVQEPDWFRSLVAAVNQRRALLGDDLLVLTLPPEQVKSCEDSVVRLGTDRPDYIAAFMREKRARESRLANAWNSMLPAKDQLKGNARKEFMQRHASRWHAAKLEKERELNLRLGRTPRRPELRAVQDAFWESVEAEVCALEEFAAAEIRKPISQRSPHGFDFYIKAKDSNE